MSSMEIKPPRIKIMKVSHAISLLAIVATVANCDWVCCHYANDPFICSGNLDRRVGPKDDPIQKGPSNVKSRDGWHCCCYAENESECPGKCVSHIV